MTEPALRLLLARHGATALNHAHRIIGSSDLPLSDVGHRQAERLARRLAIERPDALYTSPLRRAVETAAHVAAACGLPARVDERLREIDFGAWEGLSMDEVAQRDAAALAAWRADPLAAPTGGEPPAQLLARVDALLADLQARHAGHAVALVSHGGLLQALILRALGLPYRNDWLFLLYNGSLSELSLAPGRHAAVYLNDHAHQGPAPA
ncbi:MAG: histidine phosphatase family protein [Anaerolineae bacterium]